MAQIIGALKGDAADVFDFACHHGKKHTKDLGLILEQMQHHYCGTLTFREQRNTTENMRQKSHEPLRLPSQGFGGCRWSC